MRFTQQENELDEEFATFCDNDRIIREAIDIKQ